MTFDPDRGRPAPLAIEVCGLDKVYDSTFRALHPIDLSIPQGEIFAMLGPNGAGKTTLINIICGLVRPGQGTVRVMGHDIVRDYRSSRAVLGLVPQDIPIDPFHTVWATVTTSRGLFGKRSNPSLVEKVLRDLWLWDKRDTVLGRLSGGMKRRVLIAKALAHEPQVLFLDEPTAGVDVELRRDMWTMVRRLRDDGVTIFLTTHYIEEADELADRVGIIDAGRLVLVQDKVDLVESLGRKDFHISLDAVISQIPAELSEFRLTLNESGQTLTLTEGKNQTTKIPDLLRRLDRLGISYNDLNIRQSTLEDIFVDLVERPSS